MQIFGRGLDTTYIWKKTTNYSSEMLLSQIKPKENRKTERSLHISYECLGCYTVDFDKVPLVEFQRKEAIKLPLLLNCLKVTSRIIKRKEFDAVF